MIIINRDKEVANNIAKSFGLEIQKGGEGSRGGKIIGHTSSGKAIYDTFEHPAHKDFDQHDHKDAGDLHDMKSREAWSNAEEADNAGKKEDGDKHQEIAMHHDKQKLPHSWEALSKEKQEARKNNYKKITGDNVDKAKEHLSHKEAMKVPKEGSTEDHHQAQAADIIAGRHGLRSEAVYNWGNKHGISLKDKGHILTKTEHRNSIMSDVMNDEHNKTKDLK